jgi:hypothetical protein
VLPAWFGEKSPPMGGIRGRGIATLLRANRLDDLSVMVREVVQNSWDARLSDTETVKVDFSCWSLNDRQHTTLNDLIGDLPRSTAFSDVASSKERPDLRILAVRDSNCHGLDGPTLGDEAITGAKNRYISFVLNVGETDHSEGDGGAFGYGRSITYRISRCMLVFVYTRTLGESGKPESRFIGSMLSDHFQIGKTSYTGRHWWGRVLPDNKGCHPIVGAEADSLAASLGAKVYEKGERGTTVLIVDPIIDDEMAMMKFISDAILWNMWPKMVENDQGIAPMTFSVHCHGKSVKIRDPKVTFPISQFCNSLQDLRDGRNGKRALDVVDKVGTIVRKIEARNPVIDIGLLALRRYPKPAAISEWSEISDGVGDAYSACPLLGHPHHVAVMRSPELVVDYFSYRESPDDRLCWSGVFRAHDETDAYFKAAEPPTHDSWNKLNVPRGRASTAVSVGLDRIRVFCNDFSDDLAPKATPAVAGAKSLARALSVAFANLVDGEIAGNGHGSGGSGGTGAGLKKVDLVVGAPRLAASSGGKRKLEVKIHLAKQKSVVNKVGLMVRAGVIEGDEPTPVQDGEFVNIKSVTNQRSRPLWSSQHGETEIRIEVVASEFPIALVLECADMYAVSIEAKGVTA